MCAMMQKLRITAGSVRASSGMGDMVACAERPAGPGRARRTGGLVWACAATSAILHCRSPWGTPARTLAGHLIAGLVGLTGPVGQRPEQISSEASRGEH